MDKNEIKAVIKLLYSNHTAEERLCALIERPDLWGCFCYLLNDDAILLTLGISFYMAGILSLMNLSTEYLENVFIKYGGINSEDYELLKEQVHNSEISCELKISMGDINLLIHENDPELLTHLGIGSMYFD